MCLSLYLFINVYPILIFIKNKITSSTEREVLRKRVKILIPQMEKSEIVNHFQKEGCPRRTAYNAINCLQNKESIEDEKNWSPKFLEIYQKESAE